jgi:3-oxoacyl-[acyl-carrier-protein] synthase III
MIGDCTGGSQLGFAGPHCAHDCPEKRGLNAHRIERYGNLSTATIPLCLSNWSQQASLQWRACVVLTSFWAGFLGRSIYLRWG